MIKKYIFILSLITWSITGFSQSLNEPNLENFQILAEKKANSFSIYIAKIASKSTNLSDKELAIKQALKLFINDTVTVQVSFCPSGAKPTIYSRTLIKYLRRLSMLNYDQITIEWVDVVMVKDLKKGADGNFYGIISIVQRFTAVKGEYKYSDVTQKHMEIVLKPYKKPNDQGEDEWRWDVYLSNVNIVEPCS
ncbi:MAG: hypothetical protein K8S16_21495 [Bacteroidales bacterium]|nr:hypothetical protein [Bacteroidales bacterium]